MADLSQKLVASEGEMQLQIREARPDDAEAIVRILNPIIAAGCTPFSTRRSRQRQSASTSGLFQRGVSSSSRSNNRPTKWWASRVWNRSAITPTHSITSVSPRNVRRSQSSASGYCHTAVPGAVCHSGAEGVPEDIHVRTCRQPNGAANIFGSRVSNRRKGIPAGSRRWPVRRRDHHRKTSGGIRQ